MARLVLSPGAQGPAKLWLGCQDHNVEEPTCKESNCTNRLYALRVLHTTRGPDRVRLRPAGDGGGHQRSARPRARLYLWYVSMSWLWRQAGIGTTGVRSGPCVAAYGRPAPRPHHRQQPHAQPVAPVRQRPGRCPRLPPGGCTASRVNPVVAHGRSNGPSAHKVLVTRGPHGSPLVASWRWPRHTGCSLEEVSLTLDFITEERGIQ